MSRSPESVAPSCPTSPHQLATFGHAVQLAFQLSLDFGHCQVAALTTPDGALVDGVILSEAGHTIDHAVGAALALLPTQPDGASVTFVSVVPELGPEPVWRDAWRRVVGVMDATVCRDWLITDGHAVRSMAITTTLGQGWT